ncbi:MAG: hypothetical protein ACF8R7_09935 [Phycisphaerales bacterium JB039]
MILYCASDLLWATRLRRLADDLGLPARPVRNPEMLRQRLAEGPASALIVDLEAEEAEAVLAAAADCRPARILAFGPHVARDRLGRARDLGADEVLTRGAFEANLPEILTRLGA